jgi:phenylpyruvate tautomerase PptA (4-oxalocrotonate tautomerase family)
MLRCLDAPSRTYSIEGALICTAECINDVEGRDKVIGTTLEEQMPLVHISLRAGKPESYRQAIFDGLYRAMRDALDVPEGDQFMTISEHDAANFRYGSAFGVARTDDLVFIQFTVFNSRTAEQKKALFRRIAEVLGESPGIRAEDIFVNIIDAGKENWSVGNGLAQFA